MFKMLSDYIGNPWEGCQALCSILSNYLGAVRDGLSNEGIVNQPKDEDVADSPTLSAESKKAVIRSVANRKALTLDMVKHLKPSSLEFILGFSGDELLKVDLDRDSHIMIGGKTGAGKSIAILSILASFAHTNTPKTLRLSLIDPKMLTFGDTRLNNNKFMKEGASVGDTESAINILKIAEKEMMRRYKVMLENNIKNYRKGNISSYVIVIDEVEDLFDLDESGECKSLVARIARLGRQAGVYLVMGTQSPSAKILTGGLKRNLKKIGLLMEDQAGSQILDLPNAHKLKGRGDGLVKINGEVASFQATYIDDEDDNSYLAFQAQNKIESTPKVVENEQKTLKTVNTQNTESTETVGFGTKNTKNTKNKPVLSLKDAILESGRESKDGQIKKKGDLIKLTNRKLLDEWEVVTRELISEGKLEFRRNRRYYLIKESVV